MKPDNYPEPHRHKPAVPFRLEELNYSSEEINSLLDKLKDLPSNLSNGASAYELAVQAGYNGTLEQWLESLKGIKGDKGDKLRFSDLTADEKESLRGPIGPSGADIGEAEVYQQLGSNTDALVSQDVTTKATTEYNISRFHPTQGISGSNKYTFDSAVVKVPSELRVQGIVMSYINQEGNTEKYEYLSGTFTAQSSWTEISGKRIDDIERNSAQYNVSEFHKHSGYWEAVKYDSTAPAYLEASTYNVGSKVNLVNYTTYSFVSKKQQTGVMPDINSINNRFTLEEAVYFVPTDYQKNGMFLTFTDSSDNVLSYRYKGGTFTDTNNWKDDIYDKLTELSTKTNHLYIIGDIRNEEKNIVDSILYIKLEGLKYVTHKYKILFLGYYTKSEDEQYQNSIIFYLIRDDNKIFNLKQDETDRSGIKLYKFESVDFICNLVFDWDTYNNYFSSAYESKYGDFGTGGIYIPSYGNTIYNKIENFTNNLNYIRENVDTKYTYWSPSKKPLITVNEENININFEVITIVSIPNINVELAKYSQSINIPISTDSIVYFDKDNQKIYYSGSENNQTSDYSNINDKDKFNIILLGFIKENEYIDLLLYNSIYIESLGYDFSIEGMIKKLLPENTTEELLFVKYKADFTGSIENTTNLDNRIGNIFYRKYRGFYIEGKIIIPSDSTYDITFFIGDNNSTGDGEKYLFSKNIKSYIEDDGSFKLMISVPSNIFDEINFTKGYKPFVMLANNNNVECSLYIDKTYAYCYPNDESFEMPIDTIYEVEDYTNETKKILSVNSSEELGFIDDPKLISGIFAYSQHTDISATVTNSNTDKNGYISTVTACVNGGGIFTFKVGLLDQYPKFVVSKEFDVSLKDGLNTIDVSNLRIPIKKGEQIAISCTAKDTQSTLKYTSNNSAIDKELFYGPNNGTWSKLDTEYGGKIILSYTINTVNSIFTEKTDFESVEERLKNNEENINKLRYVYDNNGTAYKLIVVDGIITLKNTQYKNVLALGNSMTSHMYAAEKIGYYGDDSWAMASTNKTNTTWTEFLKVILQQKQNDAKVTPFNINTWENNYIDADLDSLFADYIGGDYDLIVFRAGENGIAGDDYTEGLDILITFLREKFPKADIVMTSLLWSNSIKDNAIKEIANKYDYTYIDVRSLRDSCLLGQMLMGVDDTLHPIINNGVAGHCTDVCFFNLANSLGSALGYTEIEGKHSVNITSSITFKINNTIQIKESYVSILTYEQNMPTVNATNISTGEIIETTIHNMSEVEYQQEPDKKATYVITFKMPDSDVNINIVAP